jgi:STE24 endopeptidase
VAAVHLWRTSVPGDLRLPALDAAREFPARSLQRAESFEAFVRVTSLLSTAALVAVLAVYAKRGHVFMRESAAGPIGTGFLLGMLGLALVWIAQLPFGLADLWWARRHDVVHVNYAQWLIDDFFGLGGEFLYLCLALLIVMALARLLPRAWWMPASAAFAGLFVLFAFTGPYLVPGLRAPKGERLRVQAQQVARAEGVGGVPLRVEEVHEWTDQPNAYAFGLGPSRRVVLWDTIVGFPRPQVRVVMAHEYGHIARHHIPKGIGWFALLIAPTLLVVALVTRRRGGLAEPRVVPLALFVVVILQVLTSPLQAAATRRYEAEADWRALQTTRDPAAMQALFRHFTRTALADPDPPGWYHALFDNHPSGLERLEMARAWAAAHRERSLRSP